MSPIKTVLYSPRLYAYHLNGVSSRWWQPSAMSFFVSLRLINNCVSSKIKFVLCASTADSYTI